MRTAIKILTQPSFLKKTETENRELIASTCKIEYAGSICEPRYLKKTSLVTFTVQSVLPLLGKKTIR